MYIRTRPHCLGLTKAPSSAVAAHKRSDGGRGEPLKLFRHLRSTTRIHYFAINEISTGTPPPPRSARRVYARYAAGGSTTRPPPPSPLPGDADEGRRGGREKKLLDVSPRPPLFRFSPLPVQMILHARQLLRHTSSAPSTSFVLPSLTTRVRSPLLCRHITTTAYRYNRDDDSDLRPLPTGSSLPVS